MFVLLLLLLLFDADIISSEQHNFCNVDKHFIPHSKYRWNGFKGEHILCKSLQSKLSGFFAVLI